MGQPQEPWHAWLDDRLCSLNSDDFRPDSVAIYTMQFAAKAVAQTAVEFRPSDGPASKATIFSALFIVTSLQ